MNQKTFMIRAGRLDKELDRLQAELDNGYKVISSESVIETSTAGFPETTYIVYILEKRD